MIFIGRSKKLHALIQVSIILMQIYIFNIIVVIVQVKYHMEKKYYLVIGHGVEKTFVFTENLFNVLAKIVIY